MLWSKSSIYFKTHFNQDKYSQLCISKCKSQRELNSISPRYVINCPISGSCKSVIKCKRINQDIKTKLKKKSPLMKNEEYCLHTDMCTVLLSTIVSFFLWWSNTNQWRTRSTERSFKIWSKFVSLYKILNENCEYFPHSTEIGKIYSFWSFFYIQIIFLSISYWMPSLFFPNSLRPENS